VITIWTVYYSLSHVNRRSCRRYKQYPLMNGTATHQWTVVVDASHRSYVEDKVSKKPLSPQTISPPKVEKPTYRPPIYTGPSYRPTANPPCKFSRRSARDICPRAKIHIFPYKGLPWGLPKVYCTDVLIFVTGAL